jgi:hypothetical protein
MQGFEAAKPPWDTAFFPFWEMVVLSLLFVELQYPVMLVLTFRIDMLQPSQGGELISRRI